MKSYFGQYSTKYPDIGRHHMVFFKTASAPNPSYDIQS